MSENGGFYRGRSNSLVESRYRGAPRFDTERRQGIRGPGAVASARRSFEDGPWRRMGVRYKACVLRRVGEILMESCEEIAKVETLDQGRSIRQSKGMMVSLAASAWEFFAGALMDFHGRAASPEP
uniref:Aldehyde dehydrogenase family protein n=1 Tax=Candidatus Kentrum sp. MB TaxID=2138164 RepID=A0A450XSY1_9GAMM|nr:MAG: Aldehyde dehydrogenase family protein [Candidatus Kentron sp. MB]